MLSLKWYYNLMGLNQEIIGIQIFFKTNQTFLLFDPNGSLLKDSDPIKIQSSHGLYISCSLSAYYRPTTFNYIHFGYYQLSTFLLFLACLTSWLNLRNIFYHYSG